MRNYASYIVAAICIIAVIYIATTTGVEQKPVKMQRPAAQPASAATKNV